MIVCFSCSPEIKGSLDFLLNTGQYKDYSEVISLAIANLAVLQEEVLETGGLVIGAGAARNARVLEETVSYDGQAPKAASQQLGSSLPAPSIPIVFHLGHIRDCRPSLADPPDDIWAIGQVVPLDRWIFGQFNRLLPAKASCRALAYLLLSQPSGVLLDHAAPRIAGEAAVLGDFLSHRD